MKATVDVRTDRRELTSELTVGQILQRLVETAGAATVESLDRAVDVASEPPSDVELRFHRQGAEAAWAVETYIYDAGETRRHVVLVALGSERSHRVFGGARLSTSLRKSRRMAAKLAASLHDSA